MMTTKKEPVKSSVYPIRQVNHLIITSKEKDQADFIQKKSEYINV